MDANFPTITEVVAKTFSDLALGFPADEVFRATLVDPAALFADAFGADVVFATVEVYTTGGALSFATIFAVGAKLSFPAFGRNATGCSADKVAWTFPSEATLRLHALFVLTDQGAFAACIVGAGELLCGFFTATPGEQRSAQADKNNNTSKPNHHVTHNIEEDVPYTTLQ